MIGINKAPITLDLETVFAHVLAELGPKAIGRGEMIAVIIQNPLLQTDGTANNSIIFVGSGTNMIYVMLPGQESPVFYAEDQKDIYVRLNFPAINPNGGITVAVAIAPGAGYAVGDVLTLQSLLGDAATVTVLTLDGHVTAAAVNAGGAGYAPGDVLSLVGGNGLGKVTIDTVDGGGAVLTSHVSTPGSGYTNATVATIGFSGAGATFDLTTSTGVAGVVSITTPGTRFVVDETYPAVGGSGAEATIRVAGIDTVLPESADVNLLIYRIRKGGKQ